MKSREGGLGEQKNRSIALNLPFDYAPMKSADKKSACQGCQIGRSHLVKVLFEIFKSVQVVFFLG